MKRRFPFNLGSPFLRGALSLSLDGKTTVLIIASTLLLTVARYRSLTPWHSLDMALLCLVAPMLLIMVGWGQPPSDYGLKVGNWRLGLLFTLGGIALITPVLWLIARTPDFRAYYAGQALPWGWLLLDNAVHIFSWEFFFRGFMLFGLVKRYGDDAIWLQAVPFAIAHFGKPELETLSTIFGGAAFGYVALKTDSMLYPFLIHFFVQVLVIALAAGML
ncbi:MAG: CPBP family intramembrane metalloprotease [Thermoflexales bacterium]|nr:CPBP family intramembrane metalloprotease [Thermoflexales bacterium]